MTDARTIIAKWAAPRSDRMQDILYYDKADEIIAALSAQGLVIVPREPTDEMVERARRALIPGLDECFMDDYPGELLDVVRDGVRAAIAPTLPPAGDER